MPRRKKRNLLPVITGFVVIIAVIAGFLYIRMAMDAPGTSADVPGTGTERGISLTNLDQIEDRLATIQSEFSGDRSRFTMPGTISIPVVNEDMNADGHTETMAVEFLSSGQLHPELSAEGFQGPVRGIRIITLRNEDAIRLLDISPDAMKDSRGSILIDQERAVNGYAFRLGLYDGEPYTSTVYLIELIMLDASGSSVSDDITLYWNPAAGRYSATNTFGAPGTFSN
ncbi:MAG: hypothetical protein ACNA8K_00390 [Cyclonatronaceae bacterium]